MDLNLLEKRVEAGKKAWEFYSLIEKEEHPHFWYTLHKIIEDRHLPKVEVVEDKKMTYDEAIVFEREQIPFGKYKGVPIGSLKLEYLLMLTEPNTFMKKLKKYVEWRSGQDE